MNILTQLRGLLLDRNIAAIPFWQRPVFWVLRIFYAVARDMAEGQLSLRAMSLVYTTLITLVPLLAISFSVLKGFGVHNQIEPLLLGALDAIGPEKAREITTTIIKFVDNIEVVAAWVPGLSPAAITAGQWGAMMLSVIPSTIITHWKSPLQKAPMLPIHAPDLRACLSPQTLCL